MSRQQRAILEMLPPHNEENGRGVTIAEIAAGLGKTKRLKLSDDPLVPAIQRQGGLHGGEPSVPEEARFSINRALLSLQRRGLADQLFGLDYDLFRRFSITHYRRRKPSRWVRTTAPAPSETSATDNESR